MQIRRCYAVLLILIAVSFAGCDILSLDNSDNNVGTLIETNREKWNEGNIQDYDYIYNRTLGTTLQVDVEVFVRQGAVDSVAVEGEPVSDTAGYLTIDDAFVRLTAAFERDTGGTFVVTFNNEYGYPREFVAGPSDDGSPGEDFFIQEFEPRN